MSGNDAENLRPFENKGKLRSPEIFDGVEEVEGKYTQLAELIKNSSHTAFHTRAGVSTAAGIRGFRGTNGVWPLEKKGLKPSIAWNDAEPTSHVALLALQKAGNIKYIVTQNIGGLHLGSGISRSCSSELRGNVDESGTCKRQFFRRTGNSRYCRLKKSLLSWAKRIAEDTENEGAIQRGAKCLSQADTKYLLKLIARGTERSAK